jgi:signal transduction histidine kinase
MNRLLALLMTQSGIDFTQLIEENKGLIFLLSSAISLIFAVAMLAPFRRGAIEKWAQFFGGGFAFFFVQYGVRCAAHLLITYRLIDPAYYETVNMIEHFMVVICSAGNNLMFLAAALTLLGLESPFPLPALVAAAVSLISFFDITAWRPEHDASQIYFHLLSLPDTIFSAICFSAIGYATATSIFYRKFPLLSLLSALVGTLYALIQIVYGFGPFIYSSDWLNYYFSIKSYLGSVDTLNVVLFAVAMLLKFFLFLPGYVLHQRSLTAFYDIQDMLKSVVGGRDEFISHDGIVSVIGYRFSADHVDLSIKLPGAGQERVASFVWERNVPEEERVKGAIIKWVQSPSEGETDDKTVDALTRWGLGRNKLFLFPQKSSIVKIRALKIYRHISSLVRRGNVGYIHETDMPEEVLAEAKDKRAVMLVPVQFHGATIGCIKIVRSQPSYKLGWLIPLYLPFSYSALTLAKKLCDLAASSIQSYRELAALDRLSLKFAQALSNADRSVQLLADILQDSLAPEAMRFVLDFGFNYTTPVDTGDEKFVKLLRKKIGDKGYNDLPTYMEDNDGNCFKLYKRVLFARVSESGPVGKRSVWKQFRLGYLVLAVRLPSDQLKKPVLGANYLHRKAIASILADAILDQARAFFVTQLKGLSTKLNKEEHLEVKSWFSDIEEAAKGAGLLWLVSRQQAGEFLGDPDAIELVRRLNDAVPQDGGRAGQQSTVGIHHYKMERPSGKTQHVVRLDLPNSQYQLWLGVERRNFREELFFSSPWETFLRSYGEIADAGLVRFTAAQEFQKLQIEAAQYQGLATVAVTMGTLAHQLTNMARNQAAACSTLKEMFDTGTVKVNGGRTGITTSDISELIGAMKWSADEHMSLLTLFTKVTKVDDRRPCSLLEAVQQATTLFRTALLQNEINVEQDVDPSLRIDVPFYVAALALGNLIGNAKDAMGPGKSISIEAAEKGDGVVCKVTDTGQGVDPKLAPFVFNLGVTSKPYSGGWGLYLVKRSLLENGANIELSETGPAGTTFTIWFPSPQVSGSAAD